MNELRCYISAFFIQIQNLFTSVLIVHRSDIHLRNEVMIDYHHV